MALQASPAAPQALQRLMARAGWLFERLQQLGLQGQQNQLNLLFPLVHLVLLVDLLVG
jgi:hypothetical protein